MAKGMGDMGGMLRQAQKMQKEMARIQKELKDRVVEGQAGGGMVRVFANGQQEVVGVKIDPQVIDPDDIEMLEDLVLAAATQALKKARELAESEMGKVTGGMGLPGMM